MVKVHQRNRELSYPKGSIYRISPEFVWLSIAAALCLYYLYRKHRPWQYAEPDYGVRTPVVPPTDPAEIARLKELDIRRAQVFEKLQEQHSKLSTETAETRQRRLTETLDKKLATIEGLNSTSSLENLAVESLKFKARTFDPNTTKPKPRSSSDPQPSTSKSCRISSTDFS